MLVAFVMLVTDMATRNLDFAPRHFAALEILRCLVLVTCKAACVKLSRECYKMPTVSRSKTQFHNTSSIFIQFQTDLRSYKFPQGSIFLCLLVCTLIPVLLLPALLAKRPATQHKDERHEKDSKHAVSSRSACFLCRRARSWMEVKLWKSEGRKEEYIKHVKCLWHQQT